MGLIWFQDMGYLTECDKARKNRTPTNEVHSTLKQEVQYQNCCSSIIIILLMHILLQSYLLHCGPFIRVLFGFLFWFIYIYYWVCASRECDLDRILLIMLLLREVTHHTFAKLLCIFRSCYLFIVKLPCYRFYSLREDYKTNFRSDPR